jgi:hypothetical protein
MPETERRLASDPTMQGTTRPMLPIINGSYGAIGGCNGLKIVHGGMDLIFNPTGPKPQTPPNILPIKRPSFLAASHPT